MINVFVGNKGKNIGSSASGGGGGGDGRTKGKPARDDDDDSDDSDDSDDTDDSPHVKEKEKEKKKKRKPKKKRARDSESDSDSSPPLKDNKKKKYTHTGTLAKFCKACNNLASYPGCKAEHSGTYDKGGFNALLHLPGKWLCCGGKGSQAVGCVKNHSATVFLWSCCQQTKDNDGCKAI